MNIVFVLYPQILATGVSVPIEMFNAAYQAKGSSNKTGLSIKFVAEKRGPVEVTAGLQLVADYSFDDVIEADWIFVPPMWGSPWRIIHTQTPMQAWLVNHYRSGSKLVATGTGVGLIALTGLLNDKVATTHWYYLPRFRKRFPDISFQTKYFITHQDGIYCAGSINALTDLVLYFIEREFGEDSLALVQQQFMHELKRNFATPFYEPGGAIHEDELVSLAQSWMRAHYHNPITVLNVAEVVGQSERQLRRRFTAATKESPNQYLTRIRIEEAQSQLRETNLSATEIAYACGYSSSVYFSRAFKKHTSMTPGSYRKIVRIKQFSTAD